ncbi:MAG: hypothetical protein MJ101_00865 [Clostridia bacterium]|nr:hypothetical protein [Clostridia bacterium]
MKNVQETNPTEKKQPVELSDEEMAKATGGELYLYNGNIYYSNRAVDNADVITGKHIIYGGKCYFAIQHFPASDSDSHGYWLFKENGNGESIYLYDDEMTVYDLYD